MQKYMQGIMEKSIEKPTRPCWNCGGTDWWERVAGGSEYLCSRCHPNPAVKELITEKKV